MPKCKRNCLIIVLKVKLIRETPPYADKQRLKAFSLLFPHLFTAQSFPQLTQRKLKATTNKMKQMKSLTRSILATSKLQEKFSFIQIYNFGDQLRLNSSGSKTKKVLNFKVNINKSDIKLIKNQNNFIYFCPDKQSSNLLKR